VVFVAAVAYLVLSAKLRPGREETVEPVAATAEGPAEGPADGAAEEPAQAADQAETDAEQAVDFDKKPDADAAEDVAQKSVQS
jgi:hypothetical protein